jgi:hypothetical protein
MFYTNMKTALKLSVLAPRLAGKCSALSQRGSDKNCIKEGANCMDKMRRAARRELGEKSEQGEALKD